MSNYKSDLLVKPVPETNSNTNNSFNVSFPIDKECVRKFVFKDKEKDIVIYHLYPLLTDWQGKKLPDEVNPRSHDEEVLKTSLAKNIETTLKESPEDFFLANRGATILADALRYDPDKGIIQISITEPDLQGVADGATTDAVLAKVQRDISNGGNENEYNLQNGRIHLEVILGLTDKERIESLVLGRNTSRQVKPWSLSDFRGDFDWIRDILDVSSSEFAGKIGYDENAGKSITILDILSILTLFHREYDEKRKAPTVAYSSKGRMDARFNDDKLQVGYKALAPLLKQILKLHDYVYSRFEIAYKKSRDGKAKLGRREGFESKSHNLPLTGEETNYVIPSGLIFPLLASLRALVGYDKATDQAYWKSDPFHFFDEYGSDLVGSLVEQLEMLGGNPQTAGKKKPVYTTLHDRARLLLSEK